MFIRFKEHEYRRVIFIASAIFYFAALFGDVTNSDIQELAIKSFFNHPGFDKVLFSENKGRFFEMEAALCMQFNRFSHQDVLGFDLELAFNQCGFGYEQDGHFLQIHTTEFDVITSDFVVECKCSASPRNGKSLAQFIKEKNVLIWARWVSSEIQRGKIKIIHEFMPNHENTSIFTLSHSSKKSKSKQIISCSWIKSLDSQECIDLFKDIIWMLSKKDLVVFFKNDMKDEDFLGALSVNKINFLENVQFIK